MKRAGICLLLIGAVLAAGSAAGGLARAASKATYEHFDAPAPAASPTPSFFVYLPLVLRYSGSASWVTLMEEGFESEPGDLWEYWESDWSGAGIYYWARRTCRSYTGSYSAWAVGGGADGASLRCSTTAPYPDDVDSWMAYGPFSLADATAANLSFKLWLNVGNDYFDYFAIYTSTDGYNYLQGISPTYQPLGWGPVTIHLDNKSPGINMLGEPEVWVALNFVSNASVGFPEGAYVDDLLLRKCVGGICQTAASAGAETPALQMREVQAARARPDRPSAAQPLPR